MQHVIKMNVKPTSERARGDWSIFILAAEKINSNQVSQVIVNSLTTNTHCAHGKTLNLKFDLQKRFERLFGCTQVASK